jgi:hypothetical protein
LEKQQKEVVIPKEQAVFGLDARGRWQHFEQGRFENPRIISYFHSCIRKDDQGYYLEQEHPGFREKVYFPCEDTALFVFGVDFKDNDVVLTLNTGRQVPLRPRDLFTANDVLYMRLEDHRVRFTEHALVRISDLLEFDGEENVAIRIRGELHGIPEEPAAPEP